MKKLWLIIQREYLTRVRKRSFILTTLLTPLAIGVFMVFATWILGYDGGGQRIAVKDDFGLLKKTRPFKDTEKSKFILKNSKSLDELLETYEDNNYDGVLHIPNFGGLDKLNGITYYSEKQLGMMSNQFINKQLQKRFRELKIDLSGYDKKTLEKFDVPIEISLRSTDDSKGDKNLAAVVGTGIGTVMGIIMYMTVFIYGMMVMRSVMEEKTSRIVEVMISSVKPFQLMMGKIIGVGAVGLTQVTIWGILLPIIIFVAGLMIDAPDPSAQMEMVSSGQVLQPEEIQDQINVAIEELGKQNWWWILSLFVFYFLGGYFLYASLFAAIGSAMSDDLGESQALTIPITIPVLIAFYIMIVVAQNPNSSLATWSSIFPLFSPLVMPARLPFEIPIWEIAVSMLVLAATSMFFVWLSARIYRVGILMYGKKASLKELAKWIFYKD